MRGHQDRRPPAQPGLRRRGDARLARGHRRRPRAGPPAFRRAAGLDRRRSADWPRASSTPSAPTTVPGVESDAADDDPADPLAAHRRPAALLVAAQDARRVLCRAWPTPRPTPWCSARWSARGATRSRLDDWLELARDLARRRQGSGARHAGADRVGGRAADHAPARRAARVPGRGDDACWRCIGWPADPSCIGPHINVYSRGGAGRADRRSARCAGCRRWNCRWTPSLPAIRGPATVDTEVFAFGRLPLAFSARCFTARHHRLNKDECDFRCRDDPDGMLLADAARASPSSCSTASRRNRRPCNACSAGAASWRRPACARLRLSPTAPRLRSRRRRVRRVFNADADAAGGVQELVALGLPGVPVDGYAHRQRRP